MKTLERIPSYEDIDAIDQATRYFETLDANTKAAIFYQYEVLLKASDKYHGDLLEKVCALEERTVANSPNYRKRDYALLIFSIIAGLIFGWVAFFAIIAGSWICVFFTDNPEKKESEKLYKEYEKAGSEWKYELSKFNNLLKEHGFVGSDYENFFPYHTVGSNYYND